MPWTDGEVSGKVVILMWCLFILVCCASGEFSGCVLFTRRSLTFDDDRSIDPVVGRGAVFLSKVPCQLRVVGASHDLKSRCGSVGA